MATPTDDRAAWGADAVGTLNDLPPEVAAGFAPTLEDVRTLPGFQEARRALFADLSLAPGKRVLEAGCGTGAALPDLLDVLGRDGQVLGTDPTLAFIELARQRAKELDAPNARYEPGDIRDLPVAANSFDAAFCDKVLIHVGPANVAVREMMRVVRPGGRVGALEWLPYYITSTTKPDLLDRYNAAYRRILYDFTASTNLVRHFAAAGLTQIRQRAFLAHTDSLNARRFWRDGMLGPIAGMVQEGLLSAEDAQALTDDWEELERRGAFNASVVVYTAAGTKPA